jgi:hypothetical protein
MSPTLTWVPGTYSAARRDDVLDPITADILHVDGEPTRWAVQIEHDPKGVTDIGDVFFGGMRLPFVTPRGRAPGLDCAADVAAAHVAAARAIAEAIIAAAGLIGTDDPVVIVGRMEATWQGVGRDAYLAFIAAADPSPPDGYIPAPVGCFDEDDDWSGDGGDHWGDDGGPELVAALNLCATLRAERDAALADAAGWRSYAATAAKLDAAMSASHEVEIEAWRAFGLDIVKLLASPGEEGCEAPDLSTLPGLRDDVMGLAAERDAAVADVTAWRSFAVDVARLAASPGAEDYADHTAFDDLPVLLDVVRGAFEERDAAEAEVARLREVIAEAAAALPPPPRGRLPDAARGRRGAGAGGAARGAGGWPMTAERPLAAAAEQAAAALAAAEQRGAERERAAIVAYLREHRDARDQRGGQHVGTGPNPAVARFVRMECASIERGAHLLGPWGGR